MVEPTKLNPRFLRSLLNASDSGDVAGISFDVPRLLVCGRPPTNRQQYLSKLPNSLHCQKGPGVPHRRFYLHAVADDAGIRHERVDLLRRESRDLLRIELPECATVAFALAQHNRPAQPALRGLEHEELEMPAIVVDWHARFGVVIFGHQRVGGSDPRAASHGRRRHANLPFSGPARSMR